MIGVEADGGSGPNVSSRPRDYALRVRVAYRAVKAVRPSCRVAVGGTGGSARSYTRRPEEGVFGHPLHNPGYFDAAFDELERLEKIEKNPKSYDWQTNPLRLSKEEFDMVFSPDPYEKYQDIHHISLFVNDHRKYRDEEHLGVVRAVKALLWDYGYRDTEIWITQTATHSGTIKSKFLLGPPQTERDQAALLAKLYLTYWSWGVKRIFWVSTVELDWPEEFGAALGTPGNPQHYFSLVGLVHNGKGDRDPGYGIRKLACHTYRLLVEKLGRADWDRLELVRDDAVVVFRLWREGKPLYVAWREPTAPGPLPRFPGQLGEDSASVGLFIGDKVATVTSLIPGAKQGKDIRDDRAVFPSRPIKTVGGRVMLDVPEEPVLVEACSAPVSAQDPRDQKQQGALAPVYFYLWLHIHSDGAKPPLHVMPVEARRNLRALIEALARQRMTSAPYSIVSGSGAGIAVGTKVVGSPSAGTLVFCAVSEGSGGAAVRGQASGDRGVGVDAQARGDNSCALGAAGLGAENSAPVRTRETSKPVPQAWTRVGPLGRTPERITDTLPLSDQENSGAWVKYEPMSDEFEAPQLDTSKWIRNMSWWKGRQPALFTEENVSVREGKLHLTMRKEPVPEEYRKYGYRDYTSAAVHSRDRACYGYFEVRAKPMNSAGSSSFWFQQDATPGWATEIDVFEIGGKAPGFEKKYNMNLHVFRTPTEKRHWNVGGCWIAPWAAGR